MWGSPLYTRNMLYYHWLIKKLLQPMAGQNIARLEEIYRKKEDRVREKPCTTTGDHRTLSVGHNHIAIHRLIVMG